MLKPRPAYLRRLATSLLLTVACLDAALAQEPVALRIGGDLVTPRSMTLQEIAALPHIAVAESRSVAAASPDTDGAARQEARITYRGVLLRDLLTAAGFKEEQRHDFRRTVIVARARDGYVALFSWAELFNSPAGDRVLAITDIDGRPVPDAEGPLVLRALGDTRPGPRHVKWLQQLDVVRLAP